MRELYNNFRERVITRWPGMSKIFAMECKDVKSLLEYESIPTVAFALFPSGVLLSCSFLLFATAGTVTWDTWFIWLPTLGSSTMGLPWKSSYLHRVDFPRITVRCTLHSQQNVVRWCQSRSSMEVKVLVDDDGHWFLLVAETMLWSPLSS